MWNGTFLWGANMSTTGKKGLQSLLFGAKITEMPTERPINAPEPPPNLVESASMTENSSTKPWKTVPLAQIKANPNQPRKEFAAEELQELCDSIKTYGLLQPIVVREIEADSYQIVAGERRFRACQMAELTEVPVVFLAIDDAATLPVSLVENLQRVELNPIEIAQAFLILNQDSSLSVEEIAQKVGKPRSSVSNYLRLMTLPEPVRVMVAQNELSMGHAKILAGLADPRLQLNLALKIKQDGLSVAQTEALLSRKPGATAVRKGKGRLDPNSQAIQDALERFFDAKVSIQVGKRKGKIAIEFTSQDELRSILQRIGFQVSEE